jgi:hypothetical protein
MAGLTCLFTVFNGYSIGSNIFKEGIKFIKYINW